jgi:hypothetical protein
MGISPAVIFTTPYLLKYGSHLFVGFGSPCRRSRHACWLQLPSGFSDDYFNYPKYPLPAKGVLFGVHHLI